MAFLGGSVLTRRPHADVGPRRRGAPGRGRGGRSGLAAPYRDDLSSTTGWVVEAFVHTRRAWRTTGPPTPRAASARCCGCAPTAWSLTDPDGAAAAIQQTAAQRSPRPAGVDAAELDALRYGLTDLLDDMAGCDREAELVFLAGEVMREAAALALAAGGALGRHRQGAGPCPPGADPDLAERLVNGHRHVVVYGDTAVLHRAAVDVLLRVGGPLRSTGTALPRPLVAGRLASRSWTTCCW